MSCSQGSPTDLHSEKPGIVSHWPKLSPCGTTQLKLQQSSASVQISPTTRHAPLVPQRMSPSPKSRQLPLQQLEPTPDPQASPAARQPGGTTHVPSAPQSFEQQSESTLHSCPSVLHRVSTHTSPSHPSEQQSVAVPHDSPSAWHRSNPLPHTKLPLPSSAHRPEQQSAPEMQAEPATSHWPAGSVQLPSGAQSFEQHSGSDEQGALATLQSGLPPVPPVPASPPFPPPPRGPPLPEPLHATSRATRSR